LFEKDFFHSNYLARLDSCTHKIQCIIEEAVIGDESDLRFSGKGWTDMTEFGTVGRAVYDFQIVVNGIRGFISLG
jgi:hypothetical protein